jgi:hypothetical protein
VHQLVKLALRRFDNQRVRVPHQPHAEAAGQIDEAVAVRIDDDGPASGRPDDRVRTAVGASPVAAGRDRRTLHLRQALDPRDGRRSGHGSQQLRQLVAAQSVGSLWGEGHGVARKGERQFQERRACRRPIAHATNEVTGSSSGRLTWSNGSRIGPFPSRCRTPLMPGDL